jgi:hypothetical protein
MVIAYGPEHALRDTGRNGRCLAPGPSWSTTSRRCVRTASHDPRDPRRDPLAEVTMVSQTPETLGVGASVWKAVPCRPECQVGSTVRLITQLPLPLGRS